MSKVESIGFLGAGKMATALAGGIVKAGLVEAGSVFASDLFPAARDAFSEEVGGQVFETNQEVASRTKVLFLAVKPAQVKEVLAGLSGDIGSDYLIVSIAAGVSIAAMEAAAPKGVRVVRVMPNTPALVGASASGFSLGSAATAEDAATVEALLSSVGVAYQVKEDLLDAVTGLSGSGPAYVYQIIEALSDGGVAAGLPRDIATRLAAQTLLGGAKMVLETGKHPGELKDMVTSPGGTTIEGLHQLELGGLRGTLMSAVVAAADKSKELGGR